MKIEAKQASILNGHSAAVYSLIEGQGKEHFFSCGSDRTVRLFNLDNLSQQVIAQFPIAVYSLLFVSPANKLIAGLGDGRISIIDFEKKQELKILKHHEAAIFDLKYSGLHSVIVAISASHHHF